MSSFYRTFNAVLDKVASAVSKIVVIELVTTKRLPIFCYGLEVCSINKTQQNSVNYVLDTSFKKKTFETNQQMWSKSACSCSIA